MTENSENVKRLRCINMCQPLDTTVHQVILIIDEKESKGEISRDLYPMSSMQGNSTSKECKLLYTFTEDEKYIILVNNTDSECYYQINEVLKISEKTKLKIGNTLIKINEKGGIWYMKITCLNNKPLITIRYELNPKIRYYIGRLPKEEEGCITLTGDTEISRVHCEVWFEDGKWGVKDLNSLNGTYAHLKKGEEIRIRWEQIFRIGPDLYTYFSYEEYKPCTTKKGLKPGCDSTEG